MSTTSSRAARADPTGTPDPDLFSAGAAAAPPLSVAAVSALIRGQVEDLGTVRVVGELSGPKVHSSGHFYADLKDDQHSLALVAWRSTVQHWASVPAHGTQVEVRGKLTTYPARSSYQLQVQSLQVAGQGVLLARLEALKAQLLAEGLFDPARKRPLPYLPHRIGLVTSPTGAVLRDILHRLAARCPRPVVLAPAAVQGPDAPAQLVAALARLNALPPNQRPAVILLARGGGSLEDLMAFNHETVVRAVAASAIPVISGVGHEPDVTLCDFAADLRAPTPTAAAELAVPVRAELLAGLHASRARMQRLLTEDLAQLHQRVTFARRGLPDPHRLLGQASQRVDELAERLQRLGPEPLQQARHRLRELHRVLEAHAPEAPLRRGYALLWRDGVPLTSAKTAAGPLEVQLADGRRRAELLPA